MISKKVFLYLSGFSVELTGTYYIDLAFGAKYYATSHKNSSKLKPNETYFF